MVVVHYFVALCLSALLFVFDVGCVCGGGGRGGAGGGG